MQKQHRVAHTYTTEIQKITDKKLFNIAKQTSGLGKGDTQFSIYGTHGIANMLAINDYFCYTL